MTGRRLLGETENPQTTGETSVTPRTIALYGKGGIGKSFTTTNLSATFAMMGKKVLQLGCDPKHDSTTSLFGGLSLPTVTEVFAEKNARNETVAISDIVFRRDIPGLPQPVYGIELGGPQVGRGCGGRGIISGFDVLEKLGIFDWSIDIILMDFLGDVVCGGFATPLARSLSEEVVLLSTNDRQSIFTANNICRANNYFRTVGGQSKLLGMIINRDDGSGIAEKYARAAGINVLMKMPYNPEARNRDDSFDFAIRIPEIAEQFRRLATDILERNIPPSEARGLDFGEFVRLFGEVSDASPVPAKPEELLTSGGTPERLVNDGAATGNEKLFACISKLPENEQRIYRMMELEKMSAAETAALEETDQAEVLETLARARATLKKLFFSS